jgi:nicotinamidase-related amidase
VRLAQGPRERDGHCINGGDETKEGALAGSDLDDDAAGIEVPVLSGTAAIGVVFSTLRRAADLDFSLTVLADACVFRGGRFTTLCANVLAR